MHGDRDRVKAALLLGGAVGFAALGQLYFTTRREYVWDAIIFFGIGLICFGRLMSMTTRPRQERVHGLGPTWSERGRRILGQRRTILAAFALLLNLIAARSANTQPPPRDYAISIILWIASLILCFATFVSFSDLLRGARRAIRNAQNALRVDPRLRIELVLVFGLVLSGLLLRLWDLEHIPANLSGDEGTQGAWAVDVLEGRVRNPFATGWFTVPTMSFFVQAISLYLFGDSVAGVRTISALIGTATLPVTYLFARRNLGRRVGLFALAALTVNHYHIHFSRLGSNQIADPFFMVLTLWLLTEGLRRAGAERQKTQDDSSRTLSAAQFPAQEMPGTSPGLGTQSSPQASAQHWFLGAGLAIGLSWYGYFGSRVIALVVVSYLSIQAVVERGFMRRNARQLTLMALIALLATAPLLLYYADFPENLNARFNQVSFFRWLENELARPDHDSAFNLVVRQVWRSISAFNHTLDPTFWYRAQIPLLDFVSGIFFLLGLVIGISQWRRRAVRLVLLWFTLAITFGWILTENPPSSMRLVIATPVVALLVALGLDQTLMLARQVTGGSREQWNWVGTSLLILAAVLNIHYYFVVYTPTRVFGNPTAEVATVLARYLREPALVGTQAPASDVTDDQNAQPFVYFFGPPFMYYDFGTISFMARNVPGVSVPPKDQDPGFETPATGPTLFVVLRERLDELAAIQTRYPNGQLREFHSEADERLLFIVYELLP